MVVMETYRWPTDIGDQTQNLPAEIPTQTAPERHGQLVTSCDVNECHTTSVRHAWPDRSGVRGQGSESGSWAGSVSGAVFEIVPYTLVPYSLYSVHDIVHYIGNREREFGHYAEHF